MFSANAHFLLCLGFLQWSDLPSALVLPRCVLRTSIRTLVQHNPVLRFSAYVRRFALQRILSCIPSQFWRYSVNLRAWPTVASAFRSVQRWMLVVFFFNVCISGPERLVSVNKFVHRGRSVCRSIVTVAPFTFNNLPPRHLMLVLDGAFLASNGFWLADTRVRVDKSAGASHDLLVLTLHFVQTCT